MKPRPVLIFEQMRYREITAFYKIFLDLRSKVIIYPFNAK
jgi:hypothetical protein